MGAGSAPGHRRRGRPPKSEELATRERLLTAAAEACVEVGFERVTLAGVASRAGVTPAAVYNHFADKADLLYTAGRTAIDRLSERIAPGGRPERGAREVAVAFLDPSFRTSRQLLLELHLAGTRHPQLAAHLADWHREFARLPFDDDLGAEAQAANVKALFLLLLGLCHLDDLASIDVPAATLRQRIDVAVQALLDGW